MYKFKLLSLLVIISLYSCSNPELNKDEEISINDININIPVGFDYSTYKTIKVRIDDNTPYAKYDVFAYTSESYFVGLETYEDQYGNIVSDDTYRNDVLNKQIFSGVINNGVIEQSINIPTFYDQVYIRRNDNLNFTSSIETIVGDQVNYVYTAESTGRSMQSTVVNDYLYCVNGSGELFQVDPLTGVLTYLSDMPMGSWTCAIDQENKVLYSIGRSSPYPLMKYSIEANSWDIIANLGIGGPRLDFNKQDRLLYFSKNDKLYTFDPDSGENIDIWTINGLHNTSGGDLAFAEDGTLFLCTFSGLYKLEMNGNNQYDSTRISADNLPFQPTSMTFDSNQELWLSNNANSSDLIIMDTITGGWQYVYGISAGNNTDFERTINDLTTFRIYSEEIESIDSDGDGILDRDDSYPNDSNKAFEIFTPSKYGTGTIAFEDLWPSNGDYDFNDVALNYQAIAILNAQNLVVQLDFVCKVKSNSAGFVNGIGIELEGVSPSLIDNINGPMYTEGYIDLNQNGTESNQENAVIILTDNADNMLFETTISIVFNESITTEALGVAPFKPFIIANKVRENEVHMPYQSTTSLGNNSIQFNGSNYDLDGNFISNNGYPWAISIIHDFKVPKESIKIYNAYNHFISWAESGGIEYKDWYKDNPGNRNDDMLKN